MIRINCKLRENGDELEALTHYVVDRNILLIFIIGIKSKNLSCQCVHNIRSGSFKNDVTYKVTGKHTVFAQKLFEIRKLLYGGLLSHQQKVYYLFETKAVFLLEAAYHFLDINTAV